MSFNGYKYSNLDQVQVDKIKKLEGEINKNNTEEVILLAFNKEM